MSQKQTFQLIYLNSLMLQKYDVQQIRTQVTIFLTSQRKIKYYISLVNHDNPIISYRDHINILHSHQNWISHAVKWQHQARQHQLNSSEMITAHSV